MPTNKKKKGKKNRSQNKNNNKKKDRPAVEEKPRDPIEEQRNNLATHYSVQQHPNDEPGTGHRPDGGHGGEGGGIVEGEGEELAADAAASAEHPPTTHSEKRRQERIKRMVENPAIISARRLAKIFPDLRRCVDATPETDEADGILLGTQLAREVPGSGLTLSTVLAPENRELCDRLLDAIKDMRIGIHLAPELACWWCGQETRKSTRKKCSGCHVATYCNNGCRKQHKCTHEPICAEVSHLFELIVESRAGASRAFSKPEDHTKKYGVKPSWKDFDIATHGIALAFVLNIEDSLNNRSYYGKGPSMEYFYCNVRHVVRDGFWFDSPSREPALLEQGEFTTVPEEPDGPCVWEQISYTMMYNYTDSEGKLRADWFRARLCRMAPLCVKDGVEVNEALTWSASDWLRLYIATPAEVVAVKQERLQKCAQKTIFSLLKTKYLETMLTYQYEKNRGTRMKGAMANDPATRTEFKKVD